MTIQRWFKNALSAVNSTGITKDIHIDELFGPHYSVLSNGEIFQYCFNIFSAIIEEIAVNKIDMSGIEMFLSIELQGDTNIFSGKPKDIFQIANHFENCSVPEIILHKPILDLQIPLNEFYRVPINLPQYNTSDKTFVIYKEYRDVDKNGADQDFIRELNLIYIEDFVQ